MMKRLVKWCVEFDCCWNIRQSRKSGLFFVMVTLSVVTTVILSLPLNAQTIPQRLPASELRGVWLTNIDSDVLFERDRLKGSLQRLDELNFNTVYPAVWNWGYTLYPSKVAAKVIGRAIDPTPGLQGRDILKEIVNVGHQQGLTVIPWFEFGFMAPADSLLAKNRPQWLTSRSDGTRIVKEGIHNRVWLNPFRPEVQQFIQDLIIEIVRNYDIDGIQFDDHFGLPSILGYDTYTVALYKKEHRGKAPSKNPQDPEWVRWRANKITDFTKRVFKAIKATKKDCLVSVAPNPQRFSYDFFLADWQKWERMGIIEDLVLQIYRDDLNVFVRELEYPEVKAAKKHIPVSIGIMVGLKNKFVPMQQVQTQVQKVRDRNFAGVSFFFYETLWNMSQEKPQERQTTFQKIFPTPVAYPNLLAGWKPSS
ncbi:MAG: glycoside hydrolase family 10 protein [Nostoc sp.]